LVVKVKGQATGASRPVAVSAKIADLGTIKILKQSRERCRCTREKELCVDVNNCGRILGYLFSKYFLADTEPAPSDVEVSSKYQVVVQLEGNRSS
jgi:hypothetical protein